MSDGNTETWGVVLRDRASGAEQWIACEVWPIGDGAWRARLNGMASSQANSERGAIDHAVRALLRDRADPSIDFVRIATPADALAAHMEGVRRVLVADEVERLRAEVKVHRERAERFADVLFAVGRAVGVEAYESGPIIEAIDSATRAALTMSELNSIGGNAAEKTERGFSIYGRVTDGRGNVVRVQRSSACGEPCCYIFVKNSEGRDVVSCVGAPGGVLSVSPHLNAKEARDLAALLVAFADDAEGER